MFLSKRLLLCVDFVNIKINTEMKEMQSKIALVNDKSYLAHDTGEEHPERPERIKWIMEGLKEN